MGPPSFFVTCNTIYICFYSDRLPALRLRSISRIDVLYHFIGQFIFVDFKVFLSKFPQTW